MGGIGIFFQAIPKISTNVITKVRCLSSLSANYKQNDKTRGDFVPIYKFPYILPLSIINRIKLYHTVLTGASIPIAIGLNQLDYISNEAVGFTLALGTTGCLTLYSLGYFTQNFIGFIYYNEEKDVVKVSYADFWGRRKNIEMPTKDVIPISELPVTPLNGLFHTFRRLSTKETLKLNLQFGVILDKEKIKNIL